MNSGNRRGSFRWGRVDLVYLDSAGVPVADVTDRDGSVWQAVRFAVSGGGLGNYTYSPPSFGIDPASQLPSGGPSAEVMLWVPEGARQRPWILGALLHEDDAIQILPIVPFDAETDYVGKSFQDWFHENSGGRFLLSPTAGPVMDVAVGRDARVQLPLESALRVSIAGEAGEGVLIAGPTLATMDTLIERINALILSVFAIETWAQLPTQTVPYVPVPGTEAPAPTDVLPLTTKALESAAFKISSLSKIAEA